MFASMGDYFIRQLKIARHYYISQYKQIDRAAKKVIKRNQFGAMVDLYIHALSTEDMSFFETKSGKNILEFLESAIIVEKADTPDGTYFKVKVNKKRIDPQKNEMNIEKAVVEHEKAQQMIRIHNNNAIISALIRFENFLTDYFEWLINKYPSKYLSEKSIKYSELLKYDYDNLKKELALDAANSIMSQPLDEWLKLIKSHKFDIESFRDYINKFNEIYYRRNVIVHNNGKVNRQYLTGTKKSEEDLHLGEKLITDKEYVIEAFNVTMVIVYGLLYSSLKANPEDVEEYLNFLFTAGFNHMLENDWSVGCYIYGLLIKDKNQDEMSLALSQINYWICRKNMGFFNEVEEEITAKDFSAMNISIRMAKEIILEHYDAAVPLLDEALVAELTPDNVETWPLFLQFRKTPYYTEFRTKYAERLEQQVIKPDDLAEARNTEHDDELKDAFKKEAEEIVSASN